MSLLKKLKKILQEEKPHYPFNYTIPNLWNLFNHQSITKLKNGEELINPYDFLSDLIERVLLTNNDTNERTSLSLKKGLSDKSWLKEAVIYSMMIRTSTSWDHDRNGYLDENNIYHLKETGTFIKTLMLLPLLKEMGVNVIYLLPISKYSLKNKKGELGSPYSVSDFFKLDENLSDPIVAGKLTLEEQFALLIEACHNLEIRVMIDFIPRTNSTESALIATNPEWFYWIKTADLNSYKPPRVPKIGDKTVSPLPKYMEAVYASLEVQEHLKLFQENPQKQDPNLWRKLIADYEDKKGDILTLIDNYYGLTIAPAFSDHINDVQPPWSDITFFRMYLDHPLLTKKYLIDENIPPYILFDTIKANLFPGQKENLPLWELLTSVIPYFQKTFGIDGARIDMGHALPEKLVKMIIEKATSIDPSFVFIAEELNPENAQKAKDLGYDIIIGNAFSSIFDVYGKGMHNYLHNTYKLPILQLALGETHDTPRLASREGEMILSKFITIINMFVPNTVPFINSGQEVYERQTMNTGIDPRENELYMLPESDPFYKKLALFDKYAFHYLNHMSHDIKDNLKKIKPIRAKYLPAITNKKNYLPLSFLEGRDPIGFAYQTPDEILFIIGNPFYDFSQHLKVDLATLKKQIPLTTDAFLLYGMHEKGTRTIQEFDANGNPYFLMGPGEIKIFTIKKG